jgi:hypothetical protein
VVAAIAAAAAQPAAGQTGSLSLTAAVVPTISLIIQNNPSVGADGFCPVVTSGTSDVFLDFGSAFYVVDISPACVRYTALGFLSYRVESTYDVVVRKSNSGSPTYTLRAALATAPPGAVSYAIGGTALSTVPATITATGAYVTPLPQNLRITVGALGAQTINRTINYTAIAN